MTTSVFPRPCTARAAAPAIHVTRILVAALLLVLTTGCETAYYSFWEQFGYEKRDLLVDAVEEAQEAQEEAKEEFSSALERFSAVVNIGESDLKSTYGRLNDSFEDAQSRAEEVSERIDDVEDVSEDLFKEWRGELDQISNAKLRGASAAQLQQSEAKYADLIKAMRRAESRMEPVLVAFRDNVLFLKHNLNAQAIASLKTELGDIEANVGTLIREMETSIAESQAFIEDMELLQG